MIVIWSACSNDNYESSNLETNVSVSISEFTVGLEQADIDDKTNMISLTLPYGTDISQLTPTITIPVGATVEPASGEMQDFSTELSYRVINGNIYKDYSCKIGTQSPIIRFSINGKVAAIDDKAKTISLTFPSGTDLTNVTPKIVLSAGVSISPSADEVSNFSEPVMYTVSSDINGVNELYTTNINVVNNLFNIAYLGIYEEESMINNEDEKAALAWLKSVYTNVEYISIDQVQQGVNLQAYNLIWWHYDSSSDIPISARLDGVKSKFSNYLENGGNMLLTSFASQYVADLGIVPSDCAPNNVFGDFLPNGFIDAGSDWGISFRGHESHPIFAGLNTYEDGKAFLLSKGTFRLNHTAWWFLPEWGGYNDGLGWRTRTGGVNLASEQWDDKLNGRVTIAEFEKAAVGVNAMVISMGAYDWYSEPQNGASTNNSYIGNIQKLTENSIEYLIRE